MNDDQARTAAVHALIVDTDPYLSCNDCFEQIDQYVELVAADPDHRDPLMDVHLDGCGVCAEEAATLLDLLADPTS